MRMSALWAAMGLAIAAGASQGGILGDAIRIDAFSDTGRGTWQLSTSQLQTDPDTGRMWWAADGDVVVRDATGAPIITFNDLSVGYVEDPVISLGFLATAAGVNTHFTISSGVLNFAAGLYTARATAAMTTTDNNGDGGLSTGNFGANDTYKALCNGVSIGTCTTGIAVGAFGSLSSNGAIGPANYAASSMQAIWDFNLSANDSAAGTSVYTKTLVPAPGAMAVLGLAGVVAGGRRRRA